MEIKIVDPHTCEKCGKQYGRTDLVLSPQQAEIWIGCDCGPRDRVYMFNTDNIQIPKLSFEED